MNKKDIYYPSTDGKTKIHAIVWEPDGEPKAILQIIHGMVEFVDRYDDFAKFLNGHGFLVCGEDHLGHGDSVQSNEYLGYFGDDGNAHVIADIHHLREMMQKEHPNTPYLMLGHSMGSFLIRQYITENGADYAKGLSGVIVMGTAWQPAATLKAGKLVSKMMGIDKVGKTSPLLDKMAFGSYLKRIPDARTPFDWLSTDEKQVDKYIADPKMGFSFTPNGFYHMFCGMQKAHDIERMKKLPEGLPILFCAGAEDPVGSWGEGVRKAFMVYTENTPCVVSIKLYDGDRHEILNEKDNAQVYADMLEFLEGCLA